MSKLIYQNLKNGKDYVVIGEATNRTNLNDGDAMVLYIPLEFNVALGFTIQARTKAEFLVKFALSEDQERDLSHINLEDYLQLKP